MKLTGAEVMPRYEEFRSLRQALHHELCCKLTKEMFDAAMDEIAAYVMDAADIDSPTAITIITDFALYRLPWGEAGKTLVEQEFEAAAAAGAHGDRRLVIEAMARSVYGLVEVHTPHADRGVAGVELRSEANIFVHDRNLGSTATPGLIVAGNLLLTEGLWSFSGGQFAADEATAFAMALAPPPMPCEWRMDMLHGGKAPAKLVRRLAAADEALTRQCHKFELAEWKQLKKQHDKAARAGRPCEPLPPQPTLDLTPPDAAHVELDIAAMTIANALESGVTDRMMHR